MANMSERQKLINTILIKIVDEDERDAEAFFLEQLSLVELKGLALEFNTEDTICLEDL